MKTFAKITFFCFLTLLSSNPSSAQVRLRNARDLRENYGLNEFKSAQLESIKIAVLDNDFEGFPQNKDSLPETAEYIAGPLSGAKNAEIAGHGLLMAQIIWGMSGFRKKGPQFYLIQSNGLTNLRAAIDKAIELKVNLILYAATWETGGNFDGNGFINAEVKRATDSGIAWINAAGNDHGFVYSSKLRFDPKTGWVSTPSPNNAFTFSVKYTQTPVKLTLSWNDFKDLENYQTEKDLDWELKDWKGRVVALKNFKQGSVSKCGETPSYARGLRENSLHSREQDSVVLNEGVYYLRISDCSGNFNASDRLRLSLQSSKGNALEFDQAQNKYEIMPPADNAQVLTIGDYSPISSFGPTLDGRLKPDFRLPFSEVEMSDGRKLPGGSSVASAIFAGIYAVLWGENSQLTTQLLQSNFQKRLLREEEQPENGVGPTWRTPSPYEYRQLIRL